MLLNRFYSCCSRHRVWTPDIFFSPSPHINLYTTKTEKSPRWTTANIFPQSRHSLLLNRFFVVAVLAPRWTLHIYIYIRRGLQTSPLFKFYSKRCQRADRTRTCSHPPLFHFCAYRFATAPRTPPPLYVCCRFASVVSVCLACVATCE